MFILLPFILHGQQEGDTRASSPEGTSATGDSSHQPHPLDPETVTPSRGQDRLVPKGHFPSGDAGGKKTSGALPHHPVTRAQHEAAPHQNDPAQEPPRSGVH